MTEEKEKKIAYISGAVIGMEKKGDIFEVELYDAHGTYFCKKGLGVKVNCGYKLGVIDTDVKDRYEIVSVVQQMMKDPVFKIPTPRGKEVKMPLEQYKELLTAKHIKIRAESLSNAIKICEATLSERDPLKFKRKVLTIAKDLEPYFE